MIDKKIRFFDIIFSVLILLTVSPIMLIISILILFTDGKPIFYKQERIGYMGRKFNIFKFRTMTNSLFFNEEHRLTFLGKILRKMSLDELPQFYNVLLKDMSIVGPRPLPDYIEKKINKVLRVKRVKILPGITGLSQIHFRGKTRNLSKKVDLDINYINSYSLYTYFKILLMTPYVLIFRFFKNKSSIIK